MGEMAEMYVNLALDCEDWGLLDEDSESAFGYYPPGGPRMYRSRSTPQQAIAYYDTIETKMRQLTLEEVTERAKRFTHH